MRIQAAAILLLCLTAATPAALDHLERRAVAGSEYVRLAEWGKGCGLAMKWNKKQEAITLAGPPGRIELTIDSRRAEIGGVDVWLSLPVVNRNRVALIALADLQKTVEPILFPLKAGAPVTTICLDPGHGGKDTGKVEGHHYEKNYTLLLAREVADLLQEAGLKVVLTRTADETVELADRPLTAARGGADLFVSLHYNGAENNVRGVEVFCLTPAGMNSSNEGGGKSEQSADTGNAQDERNVLLAYQVQKSIVRSLPLEDLGMKRSRFEVLREAQMPAILIEGGFMSDAGDARNIYDPAFRRRMARAVADGILAYKRTTERP